MLRCIPFAKSLNNFPCQFKKLLLKISKEDTLWRLNANKVIDLYLGGVSYPPQFFCTLSTLSMAGRTHLKGLVDTQNPRPTEELSDFPGALGEHGTEQNRRRNGLLLLCGFFLFSFLAEHVVLNLYKLNMQFS